MRKLHALRSWFTLEDASVYLSDSLGEPVNEADILGLALDHKVKISAIFVDGACARLMVPVSEDELQFKVVPTLDGKGTLKLPIGGQVIYAANGGALQAQDSQVFWLDDDEPYDLTMLGGERADVQRRYWERAHIAVEETSNIGGTFVAEGTRYFQLMGAFSDRDGYYPIGALPANTVLVVRRGAIDLLLKSLELSPAAEPRNSNPTVGSAWPWGTHETELLRQLAAAADRWWKNFDPSDNTTAPTNADVSTWLCSRGVGQRTAEVMATILRVDGLPTGPRK